MSDEQKLEQPQTGADQSAPVSFPDVSIPKEDFSSESGLVGSNALNSAAMAPSPRVWQAGSIGEKQLEEMKQKALQANMAPHLPDPRNFIVAFERMLEIMAASSTSPIGQVEREQLLDLLYGRNHASGLE